MKYFFIYGCGDNSNAPGCAGELVGNCVSHRIVICGAGWRQRLPGKNVIKEEIDNYVNNARLDPDWLGREVDLINLPMNVKHFVSRLASDGHAGDSPKVNIVYMSQGSETISSGSRM
jgi:hypothetical protein